ncbi:IclR family transcriptional regulator [Desulfosporosinus fructosivorans]
MDVEKHRSEVPAVEAAIRILEYLSRYKNINSPLSDISKNLSINKSTCHRILKVLEDYHFVFFDNETKQYGLGSYLIVLGARASEFTSYLEVTKPVLRWLCTESKQTSVLLEPISDIKLMYVAKEEANLPIRVTVSVGQQFPLTSASFGKCYLAFLDESLADKLIKRIGFIKFTNKSITNVQQFKDELDNVRLKGYALSFEEHTPGVFGIAAPIFDQHKKVILVIGCVGLSHQLDSLSMNICAERVTEAASRITELLGGRIPES